MEVVCLSFLVKEAFMRSFSPWAPLLHNGGERARFSSLTGILSKGDSPGNEFSLSVECAPYTSPLPLCVS